MFSPLLFEHVIVFNCLYDILVENRVDIFPKNSICFNYVAKSAYRLA